MTKISRHDSASIKGLSILIMCPPYAWAESRCGLGYRHHAPFGHRARHCQLSLDITRRKPAYTIGIAQMYQTLANQGIRIPLRSIQSIYNHSRKMMAKFPLSGKARHRSKQCLLNRFRIATSRATRHCSWSIP